MRKFFAALSAIIAVTVGTATSAVKRTYYPKPPRKLAQVVHRVFRGHHEQTAICEAWVESHYNRLDRVRGATWSRTGDHGYWQINFAAHHRTNETELSFHRRLTPMLANAEEAYAISRHGTDWWPWTSYSNGLCRGLN